jgi:hypothetical protein
VGTSDVALRSSNTHAGLFGSISSPFSTASG